MPRNPILEEIYETREQLVAEFKGDLHAYVEDARKRVLASGRPIAIPQRKSRKNHVSMNDAISASNSASR